MTNQEAFNRVWNWFVVQRQPPSYDEEKQVCLYRGPKGERCAIGVLIPDSFYTEEMEGKGYRELVEDHEVDPGIGLDFAERLQAAHDDAVRSVANIKDKLRRVADLYDLTIPEQTQ